MTVADRILGLAGFDAALTARLGQRRGAALAQSVRPRLIVLALLGLTSSVLIGLSAGYAGWLVFGGAPAGLAFGAAFGAGTLNLLRVATAGGGIAPHLDPAQASSWRPSWLPAVIMALLGLCFAQPALVALHAARLEPQVEHYRAARLGAQLALEAEERPVARERQARFRSALASQSFLVQRTLLVWREPSAAQRDSLVFAWLCLLPLLAARWPLGRALHAYEMERYRRARRFVAAQGLATDRALQRLLEGWRGAP